MGLQSVRTALLVRRRPDHRRRQAFWRRPGQRPVAGGWRRQPAGTARLERTAAGAHRLYGAGAGARAGGPADRSAAGMTRRAFDAATEFVIGLFVSGNKRI